MLQIRLYDGYALRCKFKGHANRSTQIRASFSPRGEFVICGSDTGWVYIWNTRKAGSAAGPDSMATAGGVGATAPNGGSSSMAREDASPSPGGAKEKNSSYESFQATSDIATVAVFAPETSQRSSGIGGGAASGSAVGTPEGSVAGGRNGTAGGGTATPPRRSGSAVGGGAGQVILVAGYSGGIKIYENMATHPQLL
jgi:hypothetical protein